MIGCRISHTGQNAQKVLRWVLHLRKMEAQRGGTLSKVMWGLSRKAGTKTLFQALHGAILLSNGLRTWGIPRAPRRGSDSVGQSAGSPFQALRGGQDQLQASPNQE